MTGGGLSRLDILFARGARMYRERWKTALAVLLLSSAAILAAFLAAGLATFGAVIFLPRSCDLIVMPAVLAACAFSFGILVWSQAALLLLATPAQAVPGLESCLEASWRRLPGFFLAGALYFAACVGGTCLLVLPGLMASLCLVFGPLIYLTEEVGPLDSLLKSWHYTRRRLWAVAGRLLAVGAVGSLPGLVPLAGGLMQIMVWPLVLMNVTVLLDELRCLHGPGPFVPARWEKAVVFVLCGFSLVPLLLLPWFIPWMIGYATDHSNQLLQLLLQSR